MVANVCKHWSIEALAIALLFVLVALFGTNDSAATQAHAERLGQWVGPIGLCLLGGWWLDGEINDPNFGSVVSAASPRLLQLAVKFHF